MNRDTANISLKTSMPGPNALAVVARDAKVQAPSTQEYAFVRAYDGDEVGAFCTDADGNVVLDFTGQIGCNPLGYGNPEVLELLAKLKPFMPMKFAGADFYVTSINGFPSPTDLKEKLIEATSMFGFDKVFCVSTGTETVENALKRCYALRGRGCYGIGFEGAFHGRTTGPLSYNQSKRVHREGHALLPGVLTVPFCSESKADCDCGFWVRDKRLGAKISKLEKMLNKDIGVYPPGEIACILFEPVQGEGGYIVPSADFIAELKRVVSEYNIPLIADEVQTGLGRTGKLWAVEHFGIMPDLICSSKALQVGAVIGKERMFAQNPGSISSTWSGGHIMDSIVGYKTLEILMRDRLWENAEQMGNYFLGELRQLQAKYSVLTDVRGLGLMDVMDFETPEKRNAFKDESFKRGFMVIGCGYRGIRFLPPLDVTKRELDIALNMTEDVLKAI
ncbi:MAG: aminotransferase class III-fold pyridoxal phosphate-dependent enzyme [Nanoarchaeota archaeon]|nr:aminotransferase class III-fold pyridoxal phosphate-dependent enzyme [Nanoarchaeota archaeon]